MPGSQPPLELAGESRQARERRSERILTDVVSVIVATHNRRRLLERTLAALAAQDWPRDRFEIVVVDNASTDDTPEFLAQLAGRGDVPNLVVLREARAGKSHAVNAGLQAARGSLFAFTDDDVIPGRGWIAALVRAMDETGSDFAAGRITPLWEVPPPSWLTPALYGVLAVPDNGTSRLRLGSGLNEHVMPIGANMAVRREVVAAIGGWRADLGKLRETLRSGEDHEFFLRMIRAGRTGVYEPAASVAHLVPAARLRRDYFRRWLYDNGRVVADIERDYPSTSRYLFRVPRYLWREAAGSAWQLLAARLRGDAGESFARETRLRWFGGYVRGAWQQVRPDAHAVTSVTANAAGEGALEHPEAR